MKVMKAEVAVPRVAARSDPAQQPEPWSWSWGLGSLAPSSLSVFSPPRRQRDRAQPRVPAAAALISKAKWSFQRPSPIREGLLYLNTQQQRSRHGSITTKCACIRRGPECGGVVSEASGGTRRGKQINSEGMQGIK